MDSFDRLLRLARAWLASLERGYEDDADWGTAWEELAHYLGLAENAYDRKPSSNTNPLPQAIRRAYEAIEAPPEADYAALRQAYHRAIRRYHPDRWGHDAHKRRIATEITTRLNESWQRIEEYHWRIS